jgi:hypothetical protein
VVTITGLSEQELKTPITGYDHSTGTWEVGTLAANGGKAKLSITIIGKKIVKSDKITAYISKSGTTEYEEKDAIKATNSITVMKYTDKPTLIPETYKGCPVADPVADKLDLKSQIATPADKTTLKFYTDESLSITAKEANKAKEGTTTYYVTNKKAKYSLGTGTTTWLVSPYEKYNQEAIYLTTGANTTFSHQNIYDLAGNVAEWTLEQYTSGADCPCTKRGGIYNGAGHVFPASHRGYYDSPVNAHSSCGFRVTLY